jgi:hypothetical protein
MHTVTDWRRHPVLTGLLALLIALASNRADADQGRSGDSPDGVPQRLVLALDGVPYDVFADMQRQGLFSDFRPVARMVSTFPSLTDVSFAAIGGLEPPEGYQHMRFDPEKNRVVGNTLGSLAPKTHLNLGADSLGHSSVHRMIGYVATLHVAVRDMHAIGDQILQSHKSTYVAYLEGTDALLHVEGRPGAERFLHELDGFLRDLQAQVRARTGRELLVDIVSDHGSTMVKGESFPVEHLLRECGFPRRHRIEGSRDVAYSLAGIIASVAITVSREHAEDVARCLAPADGVDLVAVDRGDAVGIFTADGEAEVRLLGSAPEQYEYRALRGDPLSLLDPTTNERTRLFDQASLFLKTRDDPRPDPLRRLWRAFHGAVKQPSQVLVSLADGHEASNGEVRALAKVRGRAGTHGSMTRLASLGMFASNWRDVADVDSWSAHDAIFSSSTETAMQKALMEKTAQLDSALPSSLPSPTGRSK